MGGNTEEMRTVEINIARIRQIWNAGAKDELDMPS